jgi:zinc/manganese transport system substrate-binding protein
MRRRVRLVAGVATASLAALVTGCGGGDTSPKAASGDCPAEVVPIVVTVDQWSDVVGQLAGGCGDVTTILHSSSVDPHDFEPSPADYTAFSGAELVVRNGLGYDAWANQAIDALSRRPAVVDAGEVSGQPAGANPHLWYDPTFVGAVAREVTAGLTRLRPAATAYFEQRHAAWEAAMQPYDAAIARVRDETDQATYGATEPVFEYLADALGLADATPPGYRNAVANESEPGPADLHAFLQALEGGQMDVLVFNTQTEGSGPDQLRAAAEDHGVPVVDVTETVAPGSRGFVDWQVGQLTALAEALGR